MDNEDFGLMLGAVGVLLVIVAVLWLIAQLPWPYSGITATGFIGAVLFAVGFAKAAKS